MRLHPFYTTHTLRDAVRYVDGAFVPGDVVEFGCWLGYSTYVIHRALRKTKYGKREFHVFDSFEGLPFPTHATDRQCECVKRGEWQRGTFSGATPEDIQRICPGATIHSGWYNDTVSNYHNQVAFAHVDCDLFDSTMKALVPLFSKGQVSDGALIAFDDWNCNRASWDCGERAAWRRLVKDFKIQWESKLQYGPMSHMVIVHKYKKRF